MNDSLPIKISLPDGFLKEEKRCGYTITSEMKRVWAVELDLLNELTRICKKHHIQFMACAGTMLGTARHAGFIPWDDDIDLMMTWENYKKLNEIGPGEFEHPYFFQTDLTDRGCTRGHIQIRNSETTAILNKNKEKKYQFNQGIFIDIFCLDHIPDDEIERKKYFNKIRKLRAKNDFASKYTYRYTKEIRSRTPTWKRVIKDILRFVLLHFRFEENTYDRFENYMHKNNGLTTKEVGLVCFPQLEEKYCWDIRDIESQEILLPFEFIEIPVPKNYKEILNKTYGDWRKFVIGNTNHGEMFIDTGKSYRDYI